MSISIDFGDLWTYAVTSTNVNLPLSALPDDGRQHVHGRLRIRISDRELQSFGLHDACMSEWLSELTSAAKTLALARDAMYVYDSGEQGYPALRLRRQGDKLLLSVEDSALSDGRADPDFQNVECSFAEFVGEVARFRRTFEAVLVRQAPHAAAHWLALQIEDRA